MITEQRAAAVVISGYERRVSEAETAVVDATAAARLATLKELGRRRDKLQKICDQLTPILEGLREAEETLDTAARQHGQPAGVAPLAWPVTLDAEGALANALRVVPQQAWSDHLAGVQAASRAAAAQPEETAERSDYPGVMRMPSEPITHHRRTPVAAPDGLIRRAPTTTIDLPAMDFRAALGSVSTERREVELTWAAGGDVVRMDFITGARYIERLSLDPAHVNLDRLNNGAPLLNSHIAASLADQIGVVVDGTAAVDGTTGRAKVRFSKRPDADAIFRDVQDGIITGVSVGYRVHEYRESESRGTLPIRLAVRWEPYELSLVSMPADPGARVRAEGDVATNRCLLVVESPADDDMSPADRERNLRLERLKAAAL
ncbi:MAG: HK97 family phage prohead protease [Acidobacteriota bacterium]